MEPFTDLIWLKLANIFGGSCKMEFILVKKKIWHHFTTFYFFLVFYYYFIETILVESHGLSVAILNLPWYENSRSHSGIQSSCHVA